MKRSSKKVTKLERTQQKKQIIDYYQQGTGLYLFKNKSNFASLELPKVSKDGKKWIQPNETWQGDSYFLSMVPKEAILVQTLVEECPKKEEVKMKEELILDQPDQITKAGKVEHEIEQELPLNETNPKTEENKQRLLTEDPLAGVTIIRD